MAPSTFYYFGFGSNMLAKRIHINNPTAVRIGIGRLEHYRLDFYSKSKTWQGAPATIIPCYGSFVLGSIWRIDCSNLEDLDNQEGVGEGIYIPFKATIWSCCTKEALMCRLYRLVNQPTIDYRCSPPEKIPDDRKPSITYLKTIIKGAIETGAPESYVALLRKYPHNGVLVDEMEKELDLHSIDL